jgi:hypothetical protein
MAGLGILEFVGKIIFCYRVNYCGCSVSGVYYMINNKLVIKFIGISMRPSLIKLLDKTLLFRYSLPNKQLGLDRVDISTLEDDAFECVSDSSLSEIIYNSIIESSFNEFDITGKDLESLLGAALRTKIKYKEHQTDATKIKYGFFGEVLLYLMIYHFYKSKPLISRGYFYNPFENSETKGYDSYHLVEENGNVELWFGEVKFRDTLGSGAKSAIEGLDKAFTDAYLEENVLAMVNHTNNFAMTGSKIEEIIGLWLDNSSINIIDEVKKHKMKLVYPILLIYPDNSKDFKSKIKKTIDHINSKYSKKQYSASVSIELFFILVPVSNVKKIKEDVIGWISSKKPLLS